jgi:hypothetical protein
MRIRRTAQCNKFDDDHQDDGDHDGTNGLPGRPPTPPLLISFAGICCAQPPIDRVNVYMCVCVQHLEKLRLLTLLFTAEREKKPYSSLRLTIFFSYFVFVIADAATVVVVSLLYNSYIHCLPIWFYVFLYFFSGSLHIAIVVVVVVVDLYTTAVM